LSTLTVTKINEVYLKISCERGIQQELQEHFSFFAPNYRWHPKFKSRIWDGKIKMYNIKTGKMYLGLMKKVAEFCKDRGYSLECDFDPTDTSFSINEFEEFIKYLNLDKTPRDYQSKTVVKAVRKKRRTFLSPTASGKSFIIYLILRVLGVKSLLIVPTTQLVLQMKNDFTDYSENDPSWLAEENISIVMGGYSKENLKNITVSTWQSLYDMPKEWFDAQNFQCVILDEAHGGKAQSIQKIMENIEHAEYRIGFTGTLEDTQMSEMTITGLFGPVEVVTETKTLIDNKTLSELVIKCIVFSYPDEFKKALERDYQKEIDSILYYDKRNKFIDNLALSLKGNTLIIFGRVDHGKLLYENLASNTKGKKVFFIAGEVSAEERESIRQEIEKDGSDCILVASTGTTSTGTNIVQLHNIINAHPTKAKIKVLQTIGRGLRRDDVKEKTLITYFDLADDLTKKTTKNYTYEHFLERLKIYLKENFSYKLYKVSLE
jgi:superfamily II DNA or RNA helicase